MPTNYIVTGYHGVDAAGLPLQHIDSATDRDRNYAFYCSGVGANADAILPVGNNLECVRSTASTVTLKSGDLISCGTLARIPHGEELSFTVGNGSAGVNRNDIVYGLYERSGETNVETYSFGVARGEATSGEAVDPILRADDIISGGTVRYFPLYRIPIRGTAVGDPERIAFVGGSVKLVSIEIGDDGQIGANAFDVSVKNKGGREIKLLNDANGNIGLYNASAGQFIIYANAEDQITVGGEVNVNGGINAHGITTPGNANVGGSINANGIAMLNGGTKTTNVEANNVNASEVTVGDSEKATRSRVRVVNSTNDMSLVASTTAQQQAGIYDNKRSKWLLSIDKDGVLQIPSFTTGTVTASNISAVEEERTTGSNSITAGNAVEKISLIASAENKRAGVFSNTHGKYLIRVNETGGIEFPNPVESIRVTGDASIGGDLNIGGASGNATGVAGSDTSRYNARIAARTNVGGIAIYSSNSSNRYGLLDEKNDKWMLWADGNGTHIGAHASGAITITTIDASGHISTEDYITANGERDNYINCGGDSTPYGAFIRARSLNGGEIDLRSSNTQSKNGIYSGVKGRYIIEVPKTGGVTANVEKVVSSGGLVLGHSGSDAGVYAVSIDEYQDGGTKHRLRPLSNAAMNLGTASYKWNAIFAANGTIQTSDKNAKKNIKSLDAGKMTQFIMGLRPVSYKFKDGTSDRTHYGMISQEVEENMTILGMTDKDFAGFCCDADENGGKVYGLRYDEFIAPLIKVVQMQQEQIEDLRKRVDALEGNHD